MKKIFIVFECDTHRQYSSYCIKFMSTNKALVDRFYCRLHKEYAKGDWYLNLAEYSPIADTGSGANVFREFEVIKSTEKGEEL